MKAIKLQSKILRKHSSEPRQCRREGGVPASDDDTRHGKVSETTKPSTPATPSRLSFYDERYRDQATTSSTPATTRKTTKPTKPAAVALDISSY